MDRLIEKILIDIAKQQVQKIQKVKIHLSNQKYLDKVLPKQKKLLKEIFELMDGKKFEQAFVKIDEIQKIKAFKFIYRIKGQIQLNHQKDNEQAIQSFQNMLKVKPNSKSAFYLLASTYQELGQFDKEIEMLEKGVAIKPLTSNNHFKCIQHISRAIDRNPKCKFYSLKIISCINVKDFDVALDCCVIALAIKPNKAKLHYLKSVTLECLNRKEEAQEEAKIASEGDRMYGLQDYRYQQQMNQMKSQLQKKQSQIRIRPSQIKTAKQIENMKNFQDSFLYTVTSYIYIQSNKGKQDYSENLTIIQPFMNNKNCIVIQHFESLITKCLINFFPKVQDDKMIQIVLSQQFTEQIQLEFKSKPYQEDIAKILKNLAEMAETAIQEMLIESPVSKIERQNKYPEFMNCLNIINETFQENDFNIYKTNGGKYGLERAIKLLGFLVTFPQVIQDTQKYDDELYQIIQGQNDEENFRSSQIHMKKQQNPQGNQIKQSAIKFMPQNWHQ